MAAADPEPGLPLVVAAALQRDDGRVLLVRHADSEHAGAAGGRWTLPAEPVADDEVVEAALARLLRERLHLQPRTTDFSESVGLPGAIANVFVCSEWGGQPQYSAQDYADAAWATAESAGGVDVAEGVKGWLRSAFPAPPPEPPTPKTAPGGASRSSGRRAGSPLAAPKPAAATKRPAKFEMTVEELRGDLEAARDALLDAYVAIDEAWRDVTLDEPWAPVDVLWRCASYEAYIVAEARRLLEEPGHTWRDFNSDQGAAERVGVARPEDRAVRARLLAVRADTEAWFEALSAEDLAAYGNHEERGAVRVGERASLIASHDRERTEQLTKMLAAMNEDDEDQSDNAEDEDDAAADR